MAEFFLGETVFSTSGALSTAVNLDGHPKPLARPSSHLSSPTSESGRHCDHSSQDPFEGWCPSTCSSCLWSTQARAPGKQAPSRADSFLPCLGKSKKSSTLQASPSKTKAGESTHRWAAHCLLLPSIVKDQSSLSFKRAVF